MILLGLIYAKKTPINRQIVVIISPVTGMPFLEVFINVFGATPLFAIENSVLEVAYIPEFAAERTAVNRMKFITCAAPGSPVIVKT
jgi:hypothetical protein